MAATTSTLPEQLLARYRSVRNLLPSFCAALTPEDMMVQSCPEASPVKWHLAHTTWFFETFLLAEFLPAYQPFHPDFRWLFNSYYNAVGDQPEKKLRASFSRPPLDQVLSYRAHVDAAIAQLLAARPVDDVLRRIVLGLEHEQQHLELAYYDIKHALFTNPLHPAYLAAEPQPQPAKPSPLRWLDYNPGLIEAGLSLNPKDPTAFAWDNETPRHKIFLAPYRLASRLVTVAEYLAFLNDSAYTRPELWLSEGWDTVRAQNWQAPLYWEPHAASPSGWRIYTLRGWRTIEALAHSPVCHLSFFEADAFARWSGHRLPTEFEWEYAAAQLGTLLRDHDLLTFPQPDGRSPVAATPANLLEAGHLHPTAAPATEGLQQIFGDVWEWTASPYTGYPGYHPLPGALGEYNGKFMSSQMVLRGGSCVTPAAHIRATYRNFFHPATRWQFAGLRLAQDLPQ